MTGYEGGDFNWIRQIRVTLSGLSTTADKIFTADGSVDRLRIAVRIQKRFMIGNPSQIMIWNLSPDTRADVQRKGVQVTVEACWRDGPRGGDWQRYFKGGVMNAESGRSGEDIVTTIYALSGIEGATENTYQRTWRQGTTVRTALLEMAQRIDPERVTCSATDIVGIERAFGKKQGWSATGLVTNSIARLGMQYGFSWSVDDGAFRACNDRLVFGRTTTIGEPELITVNAMLETNWAMATGVSWSCQLADMRPLEGIRINSSLPENRDRFKDTYMINQITHDMDSHNPRSFVTSGTARVLLAERR